MHPVNITEDSARRAHIHTYANYMSQGDWLPYKHCVMLSNKVRETVLKPGGRLLVSMPPRHGKSEFISRWTPAWYLDTFPHKRIVVTSYAAEFASEWGAEVLGIFANPEIPTKTQISSKKRRIDNFKTTVGKGGMRTTGIGGPITGLGFDLGIIDDPIKNFKESQSALVRRQVIKWYQSTFYTRREPGASIIVLMTRWHQDDLYGWIKREDPQDWDELCLPAIAEEDNDPIGRMSGEALCPERYDEAELELTKGSTGPQVWAALYQQRPSPAEGNLVKRTWWNRYETRPPIDAFSRIITSWDLTVKDTQRSDFVVGQVWGVHGSDFYLLDSVRERAGFVDTLGMIRAMAHRWPGVTEHVIEDKANGPAAINALIQEIPNIVAHTPQGSKESRAQVASVKVSQGRVFIPSTSEGDAFIDEWAVFPNGSNDDRVDASTQALMRLAPSTGNIFIGRAQNKRGKRDRNSPDAARWRI